MVEVTIYLYLRREGCLKAHMALNIAASKNEPINVDQIEIKRSGYKLMWLIRLILLIFDMKVRGLTSEIFHRACVTDSSGERWRKTNLLESVKENFS